MPISFGHIAQRFCCYILPRFKSVSLVQLYNLYKPITKLSPKLFHLFFGLENMIDEEPDTAQLQRFPAFWMKNSDVFWRFWSRNATKYSWYDSNVIPWSNCHWTLYVSYKGLSLKRYFRHFIAQDSKKSQK